MQADEIFQNKNNLALNITRYPNTPNLTGDSIVVAISVINLLMLAYASILMWFELKGREWLRPEIVGPWSVESNSKRR